MEDLNQYYENSASPRPQRHFLGRFVKDMRHWNLRSIDFMHYSIPMFTALPSGWRFPSQFMGQYEVYNALKHLMSNDSLYKRQVGENSLKLSDNFIHGKCRLENNGKFWNVSS